ncbi:unnamed protein product [Bemisia tabaci]|uniref:Putative treble-clef zinc-finger domain-containing protein n=1 Tax=Bemisia tabaci TaxID=7038 RepID=A0A9P0A1E7_BEMTA|nr:PREDICTED: uncharacterized protein C2orf42 homolog [Bemisia tabaci]XP_018901207.1 PREDICTED: uncharacterized protein C2orf42 homolog [Bemisia tabaci]XP_018901208.1 PREDICTED: uncharacterized protein C2orf42 homolog [Bemisia tabaci]CAH0382207.1 unnamed protein product [Bemisia tabaci]
MPNDQKWKAFLSGLGKSTLRGVKKCPKCGTYNGTRGVSCKNKSCDVVFKEAGEKRKLSTEACKLVTGTSTQIFSVRMRDKGPDYRGFVQLPVIQSSLDSALDSEEFIQQTSALCFVDSCQRIFNTNILKCHEKDVNSPPTTCQHIQAALRCYSDATPLPFDNAVFQSLQLPADVKQTLWLMAAESPGPIVQRVSRTMMAVKCNVSSKHPLGFLHFAVFVNRTKNKLEYKYSCACKSYIKTVSDLGEENSNSKQCIHYYACVCAFASDAKHKEEFAFLINPERQTFLPFDLPTPESQPTQSVEVPLEPELTTVNDKQLVAILSDVVNNQCQIEVEVSAEDAALLNGFALTQDGSVTHLPTLEMIQSLTTDNQFTILPLRQDSKSPLFITNINDKKTNLMEAPNPKTNTKATKRKQEENFALNFQTEGVRPLKVVNKNRGFLRNEPEVDEENTTFSFYQWLASVTERINQEMHYQFDGKPRTLTFQVPHAFFECLRERISSISSNRKRLPNSTVEIIRDTAVPLGTFTKSTWNINNIIHLKQIFDTPLMLLDITRSFVQNPDGTYDLFESSKMMDNIVVNDKNVTPIRPFELKTYIKIGRTSKDQVKPTPFIIDWIPNMLPASKIGEMRLTFEYGHQSPFGFGKLS